LALSPLLADIVGPIFLVPSRGQLSGGSLLILHHRALRPGEDMPPCLNAGWPIAPSFCRNLTFSAAVCRSDAMGGTILATLKNFVQDCN
jgi:hypothetical protein